MARSSAVAEPADFYGAGGAVGLLETQVAELLGKEDARFFINGVTAQLSVLRTYCEVRGTPNLALHPLSHLDVDEAGAIERVGLVRAIRLGRSRPFSLADVEGVAERLAAVVVELPLRRAGYLLPPIEELRALSKWCRERAIPLHFDGARIWEAAAGYGLAVAELAALADSVYVSFYKGLGGIAGAAVAGTAEQIRAIAPWKARYGGNLHTSYPYAIAALDGIDRMLPRMPAFVERAKELAARLKDMSGLILNPATPCVNAFQIVVKGSAIGWQERNRDFARRHGIWLFSTIAEAPLAGHSIVEVVIGDASDHYSIEEAAEWIRQFTCG